jgi:glycosyltransferase involved in cell wall biosynthesis
MYKPAYLSQRVNNMNNEPVSVVLCSYNGARFIEEQVRSILAQSYTNIELVISDDGSTDDTVAIIRSLAEKDDRIRLFVQGKNLGYNKNFEQAFGYASNHYIAISDQDDTWHPDKIRTMMQEWPAGSEMVYSISSNFDSGNPVFLPGNARVHYKNFTEPAMLVFDSPVHGHACMVTKALVAKANPFPADVFYDWWLSMYAASASALGVVQQTLTWHRVHNDNFSRNLTSIQDKKERKLQLRAQMIHFLTEILQRKTLPAFSAQMLSQYRSLMEQQTPGKFSASLFRFFVRHRKIVFHYKKKLNIFSVLKRSYRRSFFGI